LYSQFTNEPTPQEIAEPSDSVVNSTASLRTAEHYLCPGELHPISRSVHLSRLASYYPKCATCPHNCETGVLQPQISKSKHLEVQQNSGTKLFRQEGIRGVYLNEMTRSKASEITAAFASLLWKSKPLSGRITEAPRKTPTPAARNAGSPQVVIGYDQRPAAPDIVMGVTSSLRRMGCEVIDIGLSTKPCLMSCISHLQADAGIIVTGAGSANSEIGLDLLERNAQPLSSPGKLNQLEKQLSIPVSRPRRQAPDQRLFHAFVPYEASLWKHFHALRPLKICCATPTRLVLRTLNRLFEQLPVLLETIELPLRERDLFNPDDSDNQRLRAKVSELKSDFGFLIDEDGMRCSLMDEQGQLIPPQELTLMLAELLAEPSRPFIVSGEVSETLVATLRMLQLNVLSKPATQDEIAETLHQQNGLMAAGSTGYYWYNDPTPTADAILTLAFILQLLSRQAKSLSALRVGTLD